MVENKALSTTKSGHNYKENYDYTLRTLSGCKKALEIINLHDF